MSNTAATSPFTWRGRPLRDPPQSTAWQRGELVIDEFSGEFARECDRHPLSIYVDLAQHWMNERHVKRPVDSLPPDAQLEAVITYHPWDAPTTDSDTGYRVNIEHQGSVLKKFGPGSTIHLRAVSGGWMERVAPLLKTISAKSIKVTFFTQFHFPDDFVQGPVTCSHFFQTDEIPERTYKYAPRTTLSACLLFTGLRLGRCEATIINAPPKGDLSHWATITDKVYYHFEYNMEGKFVPRTHRVQAAADFDFTHHSWMKFGIDETGLKLRWQQEPYELLSVADAGEEQQYELFVKMQEGEHDSNDERKVRGEDGIEDIYLHNKTENKWFVVVEELRSLVHHVRRELKYKEESEQPTGISDREETQRWYAVESGFSPSKNPVYFFAKCNRYRTLIDRKVIKPVNREPLDPPNDNFGRDVLPREIYVNQYIDRMPPPTQDLYTRCEHYSVRCPTGAETWYMYLRYEDGGSLSGLHWKHFKLWGINKTLDVAHKRPDFMEYWPEIWLWYIFERLVRGCERLRREPVVTDKQWGFLHYDLKPSNILLKMDADENYRSAQTIRDESGPSDRAHPIPVLADFEFCHRVGCEKQTHHAGTTGYIAPEIYDSLPCSPERIDVFQIGCIMYGLMRNLPEGLPARNSDNEPLDGPDNDSTDDSWKPPDHRHFDVAESMRHWDEVATYANMYSYNLTSIVKECLIQDPEDRPYIGGLLFDVQRGLLAHDRLVGGALEKEWTDVHMWHKVRVPEEHFQVGQSLGKRKKQRKTFGDYEDPGWDPYANSDRGSAISLFENDHSD